VSRWQIRRPAALSNTVDQADGRAHLVPPIQPRANPIENTNMDLKVEIHRQLLDLINLAALDGMSRDQVDAEVGEIVHEQLALQKHALNLEERRQLVSDVLDELLGLGPLEPLLKDTSITDILVNGPDTVFVERNGRLEETAVRFKDEKHLLRIIQKIVAAVGRRIDESSPFVDARLADGSRVNAVVPPLAVDGSALSIRKFARVPINMAKLIEFGSVPEPIATVLEAVVQARRNVLISGGTGSGPANIEGKGEITQRDLVKNALRMRPDRIIVGEVRTGEAFDMLQAMNTGHDGSMTTVHANKARDALTRVEQMIGMSGIDISPRSARNQIASALNIVIQVSRLSDGRRRLLSLSEITGMEGEMVTMQDIFRFKLLGRDDDGKVVGHFESTGIRPKFMSDLSDRGIHLPPDLFRPELRFG